MNTLRWMRAVVVVGLGLAVLGWGAAQPARAQGGPEEEFDFQKAMREIDELMRRAEESLIESIRTGRSSDEGERARRKIDELLKSHQQSGAKIIEKINEIIEKAPRSGGGGGGSGQMPPPDGGDPKGRDRDDRKVTDRDPRNRGEGGKDPKNGRENEPDPKAEDAEPPAKDPKEKAKIDLAKEWLAQLPPTLRSRVLNGDFEEIPEKYRPIIEAYFKKLAEMDR